MKKTAILVTGVGGDIGENIVKCLEECGQDITLYGCDADKYPSGRSRVKECFVSPRADNKDAYSKFLDKIIQEKKIDYIFPSSEIEIDYFNLNRGLYDGKGVRLIINNKTILDNFLDKYNTSMCMKKHGLAYPKTFLIDEYKNELPYPVILKKRKGSGSKIVLVVKNDKEMEFYREKHRNEDMIVQEYLGSVDEEYTIGVFSDGKNIYCMAFRRYLSSDVGVTKYAELVIDKEIDNMAKKIAECSGLNGCFNVQARKTKSSYIPFEINPRISGTAYVRHHFGFKDVQWWLDILENRPVSYTLVYKSGVGVRSISETFFDMTKIAFKEKA
jgi:carbamoyl-phosphate synthase large subunit